VEFVPAKASKFPLPKTTVLHFGTRVDAGKRRLQTSPFVEIATAPIASSVATKCPLPYVTDVKE
jgi:hypothetical protein